MIIHWSLTGAGVVPLLAFENTKSSSYLGKLLILQIKNKKNPSSLEFVLEQIIVP